MLSTIVGWFMGQTSQNHTSQPSTVHTPPTPAPVIPSEFAQLMSNLTPNSKKRRAAISHKCIICGKNKTIRSGKLNTDNKFECNLCLKKQAAQVTTVKQASVVRRRISPRKQNNAPDADSVQ